MGMPFLVKPLLLTHLITFGLFCLFGIVGYSAILISLHIAFDASLAQIHQSLQSSPDFHNSFGASIMVLAAIGGGWVAAAKSKTRPLFYGALSGIAFFALFLLDLASDLMRSPSHFVDRIHSPLTISELLFPAFGFFGSVLMVWTNGEHHE